MQPLYGSHGKGNLMEKHVYTVTFTDLNAIETLNWLDSRGYLGNFLSHAERIDEGAEDSVTFGLSESSAWAFLGSVVENPGAFLTFCGDEQMFCEFHRFLNTIV